MEILMRMGLDALELLGPLLVAAISVPVVDLLKRHVVKVGDAGPLVKQLWVIMVASWLTLAGYWLDATGAMFSMFAADALHLSGPLSALMAMGLHNLRKRLAVF